VPLFKIPKKTKEEKLAKLSEAEKRQLDEIEAHAIAEFEGQFDELEAALGMLRMGHHVGWKILYLVHSKRTIRKYEDILGGIKVRDIFPEFGPSSYRSRAYIIVQGWTNFWKGISGEEKIEGRREIAK